ncbi:MAG: hypothetical protein HUU50_10135 [Candidatus Brocadiae bacterium]|nr:hypothetical protein [Candidatus Brocadiia bacterium]
MSWVSLCFLFLFLSAILGLALYNLSKEKIFLDKLELLQKKQTTLESLLQKKEPSSSVENIQEFIQKERQEILLSFHDSYKILENEISIIKKQWDEISGSFQGIISTECTTMREHLWRKWEEEKDKVEQSFHKKIIQSQKQTLSQALENWDKKQEDRNKERQKEFSLLCNTVAQFIPFFKFFKKKQEETVQSIATLESLLNQIQEGLSPLKKEVLSWQKEPLARRNDLEKKKISVLLDYEDYKNLRQPLLPDVDKAKEIKQKIQEEKIDEEVSEIQDKEKTLLSKIHKQKMHFVGFEMQQKVLYSIYEVLREKKKIIRSEFLSELIDKLSLDIAQKSISKTKINGVVNILQAGRCFDIAKQSEDSKAMLSLAEKYQDYKELRKAHDMVLYKLAKSSGISLSAQEWAVFLYNDPQKTREVDEILDSLE